MYALIGLCLVLTGLAGLQFIYMFWVERMYGERRKHTRILEHKCRDLTARLAAAERRIAEQNETLEGILPSIGVVDEPWADVIEEH